jgi:hypothetical protein
MQSGTNLTIYLIFKIPYIFGSGSTENEIQWSPLIWNQTKISTNNLTDLYAVMQSFESIFNLEVIYTGEGYLFNHW